MNNTSRFASANEIEYYVEDGNNISSLMKRLNHLVSLALMKIKI